MKVTVRDAGYGTSEYDLESMGRDSISFGRMQDCDIVLRSAFVSRPHGVIYRENGGWYIQDMMSTYGTYYMDRQIKSLPLADGMVIKIFSQDRSDGKCVELAFHEDYPQVQPQPQYYEGYNDPGAYAEENYAYQNDSPQIMDFNPGTSATTSPLAIASMIFGFLGLVAIFTVSKTGTWMPLLVGVLAVIFGLFGITAKNAKKGMAIAGLVMGIFIFILALILTIKVKGVGPFYWYREGKGFPLYKMLGDIFDPHDVVMVDELGDELQKINDDWGKLF